MKITDRVYGNSEITEPIILELINSSALQRLKDIDQAGYFEPHFPGTALSRFEHSVGVYLLLKKYGAPIEEQIAGLIHDVSHAVFSHCIDYVLSAGSGKEQNHQDNVFEKFVKKSAIPAILRKYHLELSYILDDKNFPLKEQSLPNLCADRIDYSLRSAMTFRELDDEKYFLDHLVAQDKKWIFTDFESAKKYAELFLKLNTIYYAGLPSAVMFQTVGDYLRHALAQGYISEADLYTTDKMVLAKIKPHTKNDPKLNLLLERMQNKIGFKNDPNNFDGEVFCKSRVIDPLCQHDGAVKRISQIDSNWSMILKQESQPKHYFIKFER
jgi:hypothetical protein